MNKKSGIIKEGLLVTIASLLTLAVAFMLYFLIFMVFESFANQDGSYGFVSPLRVGYGIIWLGLCLIVYRTTIYDWLKAGVLTASLTTFMVGIGVQLYESPIVVGLVLLLVASISVFLLHK
ncbi:MAG TPA: hypothetical protein PK486_06405, partial [Trichococcus flocculiformis]|nr:hypothetical protein [Trichococcus flocculiformis]